jgi:hypothetical protein
LAVNKSWIKRNLSEGNFRLSVHAASRIEERYVFEADIKSCGRTAKKVEFQPADDTWKVVGKDLDGFKLTVICSVRSGMLIVTVY